MKQVTVYRISVFNGPGMKTYDIIASDLVEALDIFLDSAESKNIQRIEKWTTVWVKESKSSQ